MKKRIFAIFAVVFILSMVLAITANAVAVTLSPDQYSALSSAVTGRQAHFWGYNYDNSLHKVYYNSYHDNGTGSWIKDQCRLIDVGVSFNSVNTSLQDSSNTLWRLELDVQYTFKNCVAWGQIET